MEIILASKSPRRKELLKKIVNDFVVFPCDINEDGIEEKDPVKFAVTAAVMKAKSVGEKFPLSVIIGADTVVSLEDKIFGKPENYEEAKKFLQILSGTRHKVITGIAIYKKDEEKLLSDYKITYVTFKDLTEEEIEEYLKKEEFADKAGSYAIQKVGDKFVKKIEGDYENVVGFPIKQVKKLLAKFQTPEFTVDVVDIALPHNWAVGKKDNLIIFVPGGVLGDRIKIRISKETRSFSYGEIVNIEKLSPFRTEPECPHFGLCGGCIFQNLQYEKQIETKQNYLFQTLKKIGGVALETVEKEPIIPSPDIYFYRNKMEFAFGEKNGKIVLGLRERSSPFKKYSRGGVVPLEKCLIFSPVVEKLFPIFLEFAEKNNYSVYNTFTKKGFLRYLVLREGKNTEELMVILVTTDSETPNLISIGERLIGEVPQVQSFYWVTNNRPADVVSFEKKHHLLGKTYIEERLGTLKFKIYPTTFFQPNAKAAELLYEKIVNVSEITENEKVLGLYCGAGPIEIFLSEKAKKVTGIDSSASNIHNALENCRLNKIGNCSFLEGTVEKLLKKHSFADIDLLIIDPPRAGISGKGIKSILELNVPRIIYMSCNPSTLARDVKMFQERGYTIKKIVPFDFFPHTSHLETLVLLQK